MGRIPYTPDIIRQVAGIEEDITRHNRTQLVPLYAAAKGIVQSGGEIYPLTDGSYVEQDLIMQARYYELEARLAPGAVQADNMTQQVPQYPSPYFS